MIDPVLSGLRTALEAAVHATGVLPMDADTLGQHGASLPALLEAAFGEPRVVLRGDATLTTDDVRNLLIVTGVSTVTLLGITTPGVSATFSTAADPEHGQVVVHLDLVVATTATWGLATTFPKIATTFLRSLVWDTEVPPRFTLRSRPGSADAYGLLEPVGLSLRATIDVARSTVLEPVVQALPGWRNGKIVVCGAVAVSPDTETLALRGAGPDASLPVTLM